MLKIQKVPLDALPPGPPKKLTVLSRQPNCLSTAICGTKTHLIKRKYCTAPLKIYCPFAYERDDAQCTSRGKLLKKKSPKRPKVKKSKKIKDKVKK